MNGSEEHGGRPGHPRRDALLMKQGCSSCRRTLLLHQRFVQNVALCSDTCIYVLCKHSSLYYDLHHVFNNYVLIMLVCCFYCLHSCSYVYALCSRKSHSITTTCITFSLLLMLLVCHYIVYIISACCNTQYCVLCCVYSCIYWERFRRRTLQTEPSSSDKYSPGTQHLCLMCSCWINYIGILACVTNAPQVLLFCLVWSLPN